MAAVTKTLCIIGDPTRGYTTFEITYDDTTLILTTLRCTNNSNVSCWASATHWGTGRVYSQSFPANQITTVNIPTGPNARLQATMMPSGKLDGIEYVIRWPE